MATNQYIKLFKPSEEEPPAPEPDVYRFRVTFSNDGYRPMRRRISNLQHTVTGKVDYQIGPVNLHWDYNLLVAADTDPNGADYGTLDDLRGIFDYDGAIGLEDHYGVYHDVYMTGDMVEEPKSPSISGSCAWFDVRIHLVKAVAET